MLPSPPLLFPESLLADYGRDFSSTQQLLLPIKPMQFCSGDPFLEIRLKWTVHTLQVPVQLTNVGSSQLANVYKYRICSPELYCLPYQGLEQAYRNREPCPSSDKGTQNVSIAYTTPPYRLFCFVADNKNFLVLVMVL